MDLKGIAKKGAKYLALKKGVQWSGGLLKFGAIAGAGYLAYKTFIKKKGSSPENDKY